MTRTKAASRPRLRLLWDELLSVRVAAALRELGFNVSWIGTDRDVGVPAKGSTDAQVIEYARRTNQVIVTSNHDMMLLCDEAKQRFVWIDPRSRKLTTEKQVLLCFSQIRHWEEILGADGDVCVRALRTKSEAIESGEAARLAGQRFKSLQRKQRTKTKRRNDDASLQLVAARDESPDDQGEADAARQELRTVLGDHYEDGIDALDDPDLADQ